MNKLRRLTRWQFIGLIAILMVILVGCTNVRRGISWPALEFVTINDQARVLVAYDGQVEAIDPYQGAQVHVVRDANGEILRDSDGDVREWLIRGNDLDGAQFFVSPFENDGTFLFPTYNDRLIEVDVNLATVDNIAGIQLTDGVIADIIVTDDLIYLPYRSKDVVALDRETYQEVWRFETESGVWATPLLVDAVLYITSIDHNFYAVDAATGESLWSESVNLGGAIASTPLFYNNFLYVGSYSHKMYQISLNGQIVNEYEGNNWIWSTPVIQDDVLYYADLSGYVYALNASNLSEIWAQRPTKQGIRPAPLVTENFVFVAARDSGVFWLDRETGNTVQESEVDGRPELLSDILYLPADEELGRPELVLIASTNNKQLVSAFNMETFSLQWVYQR